ISPRSVYGQVLEDLKRIEQERREVDFGEGYIGKALSFAHRFIPQQVRMNGKTTNLERRRGELERLVNKNIQRVDSISKKIADADERKWYSGILLERYDLLIEKVEGKKESLRDQLNTARGGAVRNPSDKSYKELEIELRALDADLRNVRMKQARAAEKVVFHDSTVKTYEGLLAIANMVLTRANQAYVRSEHRIGEARTLLETGISPTKDVVEVIGKAEEIGSSLDEDIELYKRKTFEAAQLLQKLPNLGLNGREDGIEAQFREAVAIESDGYIDTARKILERDRTAA
ncbi:MAG: hypothetical protein AABX59_03850, partial [Nanoarchaeota archaeon]